jgi:GTP cyclohydrolase III
MAIAIERLIDGCLETLRADVLPDVGTAFARGQVWAVMDILQNLRDRVEVKQAFAIEEARSAEAALERCAGVLRDTGRAEDAASIESLLARRGADGANDPGERVVVLRAAIVTALAALHHQPGGLSDAGREALAAHLTPQTVRDIAALKPSLLNEISKG